MTKMGYNTGKGLGNAENGIKEPITIKSANSMLNQMNGELLTNKYEVRVKSHGGC